MLHDPKDLNVKQMGPRHSSKTHTVLFGSFDTSFGYICLFFLKYICAHKLETKVHRQKSFLEMFCLFPRKDGKQKELSHLTDVWKKSYQKAKSLVCLCMLGLWTKFSGYVHIRNNKFTAIYCPVSL